MPKPRLDGAALRSAIAPWMDSMTEVGAESLVIRCADAAGKLDLVVCVAVGASAPDLSEAYDDLEAEWAALRQATVFIRPRSSNDDRTG